MVDFSLFSTNELIIVFMIAIGASFLFKELYAANHHGKLLIKVDERRNQAILWIVILVLWVLFLINDIRRYLYYRDMFYIDSILNHILWIEVSFINILGAIRHSDLRENGIYFFSHFYRWHKIQSYTWISSNIVQFRVITLFKIRLNHKLIIDRLSDKSKIDEILDKSINL